MECNTYGAMYSRSNVQNMHTETYKRSDVHTERYKLHKQTIHTEKLIFKGIHIGYIYTEHIYGVMY